MNQIKTLFKTSQFVQWLATPSRNSSCFEGSRIFKSFLHRFRLRSYNHIVSAQGNSVIRWLLALLLFSCIFSPLFYLTSLGLSRVDLRAEDFFMPVLGVMFLFILTTKSFSGAPAAEKAFLGFLIMAEVSILNGFILRTIDKPFLSLLYLVKWMEYFLVFALTCRVVNQPKDSEFCLKVFFLLGLAIACYGYWEHFFPFSKSVYPNYYRIFERPPFRGDANHMGGFFVLWTGFFAGLFFKSSNRREQILFLMALLFGFFPLIWTYSRKSYFALAGALLFSFFLPVNRRKPLLLVSLFALLGLLLPTRLSERILDLQDAFASSDPFHSSWAGNWFMWKESLWNFDRFFLLGSGLGSRHRLFYESQYVLVLAEMGIAGFASFAFLCLTLIKQITALPYARLKPREQGMALGWIIAFTGFLIHSSSCVTWTTAKAAIIFWFLTGFVFTHLKQAAVRTL